MRHGKRFNHLSRKTGHRKAMLANMACSLIEHKRITTTVAKAKALRKYVEPVINRSKEDSTHSRRMAFRYLKSKYAVTELFRNVGPAVADRPGGFTRIIKTGFRPGDGADMCLIEIVDFNDQYSLEKKKKTRRSRRGGAKKVGETAAAAPAPAPSTETESVKETAEKAEDAAQEAAASAAEEAKDIASTAAEKVEEVVEEVKEAAKDVVEEVAETVEEVAEEVTGDAEEAKEEEAPADESKEESEESEEEKEDPKAEKKEDEKKDSEDDKKKE